MYGRRWGRSLLPQRSPETRPPVPIFDNSPIIALWHRHRWSAVAYCHLNTTSTKQWNLVHCIRQYYNYFESKCDTNRHFNVNTYTLRWPIIAYLSAFQLKESFKNTSMSSLSRRSTIRFESDLTAYINVVLKRHKWYHYYVVYLMPCLFAHDWPLTNLHENTLENLSTQFLN